MSTPTTAEMSAAAADALQRVLNLDLAERAKVVDKIIETIPEVYDLTPEQWDEVECRIESIENGTAELIDADEFMEEWRREIESRKQQ